MPFGRFSLWCLAVFHYGIWLFFIMVFGRFLLWCLAVLLWIEGAIPGTAEKMVAISEIHITVVSEICCYFALR